MSVRGRDHQTTGPGGFDKFYREQGETESREKREGKRLFGKIAGEGELLKGN